jgi:hypothetical protein
MCVAFTSIWLTTSRRFRQHGVAGGGGEHESYQIRVAEEISKAHHGLTRATHALIIATWWLAVVTVALGAVEFFKLFAGH